MQPQPDRARFTAEHARRLALAAAAAAARLAPQAEASRRPGTVPDRPDAAPDLEAPAS